MRVRARELSGEGPAWYVYRDGHWRAAHDSPWWTDPRAARIDISSDGWIVEANPLARSLLGVTDGARRHFSEFVAPGTMADAISLFDLLVAGRTLEATLRVRPITGDMIAVDIRTGIEGDRIVVRIRLAEDVDPGPAAGRLPPALTIHPPGDTVFAAVADAEAARLSGASPEELALRLHALYPHAVVEERDGRWYVSREAAPQPDDDTWWAEPGLPLVRYDPDGLILEANGPARGLLGADIVGRHWQDVVTPGTDVQVARVIELIRAMGFAVSRFRLPAADGMLVEFDSYTAVDGDTLTTIMRPG